MAGSWQHNGHALYVSKVTGSTYESHTENDVYLRGLTVSGTSVTSPDLSWEGTLPQRNVPTLTGVWSRSNAGYSSSSITLTLEQQNCWLGPAIPAGLTMTNQEGQWSTNFESNN